MKKLAYQDPHPYVSAIKRLARILHEIEEREDKRA